MINHVYCEHSGAGAGQEIIVLSDDPSVSTLPVTSYHTHHYRTVKHTPERIIYCLKSGISLACQKQMLRRDLVPLLFTFDWRESN